MIARNQDIQLREASAADQDFIEKMAYLAGFPFAEGHDPSFEEGIREDWLQPYFKNFGEKEGDVGLIAEDADGRPIGAAWFRTYGDKNSGTDIPVHELSIAVAKDEQGKKVGRALLALLMEAAKASGVDRLGLQVAPENRRAIALYEKLGFSAMGKTEDGENLMVANLG
jgi:ribosomal protein S18 acetylase RimI-like enzyme